MAKEIQLMKKGEAPSLIEAAQANLLINAVNALRRIKITPQGAGTINVSDSEVVIDLSSLMNGGADSSTSQASGNGAATSDQPNNATSTNSSYEQRITALENRANGASISAVCNSDGTITVTLHL